MPCSRCQEQTTCQSRSGQEQNMSASGSGRSVDEGWPPASPFCALYSKVRLRIYKKELLAGWRAEGNRLPAILNPMSGSRRIDLHQAHRIEPFQTTAIR